MSRRAMFVLAVLAGAGWNTTARAGDAGGIVSASGEAVVKVLPTALRVEFQLNSTDTTLDAAMKQLNARRDAALEKLKTLKADADSIRASTPTVTKFSPATYSKPLPYTPPPPFDPYATPPTIPTIPHATPPTVAPPAAAAPAVPRSLVPAPAPVAPPAPAVPPSARELDEVPAPAIAPPGTTSRVVLPSSAPISPRPVECELIEESALELAAEPAPEPTYRPGATGPAVPSGTYAPPAYPAPAPASPSPFVAGGGWCSVSTTITADWPLESDGIEALAAEVEKLQAKIVAADLLGTRPAVRAAAVGSEATPAAAPRGAVARPPLSVAPARPVAYPSPVASYPPAANQCATPYCAAPTTYMPATAERFLCVAKLSDRQRKAALAEAFGKAKAEAAELAEAAGGKLGRVESLNRSHIAFSAGNPPSCYSGGYCTPIIPVSVSPVTAANDAVTGQPAETEFRIQIQAQFRIE